jgi:nucleoid-associated protein YgaU
MNNLNIPVNAVNSRCPLLQVDGTLEFSTRVPLAERERPGDLFYVTTPEDKLPLLAYKFYGDPRLWWVIYDVNASKLQCHPLELPVGVPLRIPTKQAVEMELINEQHI